MSTQYEHHVLPHLAHHSYLPEPSTVGRLVDALVAAGWLDAGGRYRLLPDGIYRNGRDVPRSDVSHVVATTLQSSRCLVLRLPVGEASNEPQDTLFWERPSGTPLDVSVCQNIELLLTNTVSVVRGLETDGEVYCGECGAPLLAAIEVNPAVGDESPLPLAKALNACPGCAAPINPGGLSATCRSPIDGSVLDEEAPVFRCALVLITDSAPDFPAVTDATLLEVLNRVTGVPFRAVGRYR